MAKKFLSYYCRVAEQLQQLGDQAEQKQALVERLETVLRRLEPDTEDCGTGLG